MFCPTWACGVSSQAGEVNVQIKTMPARVRLGESCEVEYTRYFLSPIADAAGEATVESEPMGTLCRPFRDGDPPQAKYTKLLENVRKQMVYIMTGAGVLPDSGADAGGKPEGGGGKAGKPEKAPKAWKHILS